MYIFSKINEGSCYFTSFLFIITNMTSTIYTTLLNTNVMSGKKTDRKSSKKASIEISFRVSRSLRL